MADLWITFVCEEICTVLEARSDEILGVITVCQFIEDSLLERKLFVLYLSCLTLYRVQDSRQLLILCRTCSSIEVAELIII